MRIVCAALIASSFLATSALAGSADLLSPGQPAGVKQAQMTNDTTLYYIAGLGLIGAGIALAASGHHHAAAAGGTTTTTTTTTGTSP